jgi:radical S-adenosyl methionine domain-containing protein 2
MNDQIEELAPFRWKVRRPLRPPDNPYQGTDYVVYLVGQVFQVLLLDSENTGAGTGSLRDARKLVITTEQFQAFLARHAAQKCLVPEDNEAMKDSYLNLDEQMR